MGNIKERLDNLAMFLQELASGEISGKEAQAQANYHIATLDLVSRPEVTNDGQN